MNKAIPVMAALAIMAAAPAVAQEYRYPPESNTNTTTTTTPSREDWQSDQQARTPESDRDEPGTVETLRDRSMSSPNVQGDRVPEQPGTGIPRPEASGNPEALETTPRP